MSDEELSKTQVPANKSGSSTAAASRTATKVGLKVLKSGQLVDEIVLNPSPDLDLSNVASKPPPRQPVEPTYRGWKEVGGWENSDKLTLDDESAALLAHVSIYDQYLPAAVYGDWFHNVGFLIVGGLLSWIVGWFRFSLAPLFFIMVVFSVLYRASIRKYRSALREQAQREFSIKSIENDYETMDWLNTFLEKFWHFLEPSVSQIVCDQVNPILASSPAPAFIKALWLDSFTAGTKPPRVDAVKTLHGTKDDVVVMDWACSMSPNALADNDHKHLKNLVNQKVIVKVNVFGVTLPIAVSDVSFKAFVRVRMRMTSSFPHIDTVNVSLLEPIQFDFNSRLLGDTIFNWEVLGFPGLYGFINEMIKKYVGPIVYAPLSFQLNVQQVINGYALDSAIGVLAVNVKKAKGIKGFKYIGNTLDPYVTVGFQKDVLAKTTIKKDTDKPVWNETIFITVKSLSEPLNIAVIDDNNVRKDKQVGSIQFDLETLLNEDEQPNLTAPFIRNNTNVGELQFGLKFMPTLSPTRQPDGAVDPPPELNTGITRIEVFEARNFKGTDEKNPISSYGQLFFNDEEVVTTSVFKKSNNPSLAIRHEAIVNNRSKGKAKFVMRSDSNKFLGSISCSLNELIDAGEVDQTWFPLSKGGEVRLKASWKPVELETDLSDAIGYTPPIGVVRVSVEGAQDLRNLETFGTVDPYARVMINRFQRARTVPADSTLDPTWNEVHYATLSSPNQKLTLEVMDVEKTSADRTLGSFDVRLNEIIGRDETGKYIEHVDSEKRTSKLIHKKGPKGTLTYSLAFYPVLPVKSLQTMKEDEERRKLAIEEKKKQAEELKKKEEEIAKAKKEGKEIKEEKKDEEEEDDDDYDEEGSRELALKLEELLEYKSGVLVFEIFDGEMSKDGVYLQAYFDNHGNPDYMSQKLKSKKPRIGNTGDCVIKELDSSLACFRLTKGKDDTRADKFVAEYTVPTVELLKMAYDKPTDITLSGDAHAKFKMQCQWKPVIYETGLPPQDSINNCGILTVEVVKGSNFVAGDRNGKSDPFVELFLNSSKEEFCKTKKVRKSLDPVWNESALVEVVNRYDSYIRIDAYDWDIGPEQDDLLAQGILHLSDVDFDEGGEVEVPLYTEAEEDGGSVLLRCSFKPEFIINAKPSSGNELGDAFGLVGKGVGGVGKGVGKGVGTVGKGVGKGVGGVGKGIGGALKKPFGK